MATLLKEINVGSAYGTWYLRLYEDSVSQDITNNRSTINLRITMRCSTSGATISFDNRDAWINSTHFTPAYTQTSGEHNLGSASMSVNHNADGTGSYSASFGISTSYIVSGSSSGGRTLPTIPRASKISSVSGSTLGSAVTVTIARASSSFTHTVKYQFGSIIREYTGQGDSCTFTPPLSDASQIASATTGTGGVTVQTYNGSTKIGDAVSKSFTLSLPASAVPSFSSIAVTRVDNGVPAAWGIYVQNKSKVTLAISGAAGIYGSSISSYAISGAGYSSSSSSFTTGVLTSTGTITFIATITDSRGRSASKTTSITVYENTPPQLSLTGIRCNSAGTASNTGTYIKVIPTYSCASIGGKNSIASRSFSIVGTSYTNTVAASGSGFVLGNNDIAVSKSYTVSGSVTDALGQSSGAIKFTVSSSAVPFNLRNDGTGAAFGKYAETASLLESAWPLTVNGQVMGNVLRAVNRITVGYDNASYSISTNSLICSSWLRTTGSTGWYNETYGGGVHMTDSTWVRLYNSKKLYVENTSGDAIYTSGGVRSASAWIGKQYASGSEWLGFYDAYGGTRKGWIGHDGSTNLNFINEAGGKIYLSSNGASLSFYKNGSNFFLEGSGANWFYLKNGGAYGISFSILGGTDIDIFHETSGAGRTILRPTSNSGGYLGSDGYRWNTAFFTNSITASDLKEKCVLDDYDMKAKDLIMELKPIAYKRTGDGDTGIRVHYGFGAQTMARSIKDLGLGNLSMVTASVLNDDGTEEPYRENVDDKYLHWGINYNELIAPIVSVVQDLLKENALLKRELECFSSKLNHMEEKLETH